MTFRKATVEDIPTLCSFRIQQLIDEGIPQSNSIKEELARYFEEWLNTDLFVEYVKEENGKLIASGAVIFFPFPPTFTNPKGVRGYITNMYTDPLYRGQGIASEILKLLIEEAKSRGVSRLFLSASDYGRPVYEKQGFEPSGSWMELEI